MTEKKSIADWQKLAERELKALQAKYKGGDKLYVPV